MYNLTNFLWVTVVWKSGTRNGNTAASLPFYTHQSNYQQIWYTHISPKTLQFEMCPKRSLGSSREQTQVECWNTESNSYVLHRNFQRKQVPRFDKEIYLTAGNEGAKIQAATTSMLKDHVDALRSMSLLIAASRLGRVTATAIRR